MTKSKTTSHRFEYLGWEVFVQLEAVGAEGTVCGHADLSHGGTHKCRIALAGSHRNGANAIDVLSAEARAFVDDWRQRIHTGETGFTDL